MKYHFITSCVNAEGDDINEMKYAAKEVTRRTFLKYVDKDSLAKIEADLGYSKDFRMSKDWHVAYYLGFYRKRRCAYFVWSAIEHIFT